MIFARSSIGDNADVAAVDDRGQAIRAQHDVARMQVAMPETSGQGAAERSETVRATDALQASQPFDIIRGCRFELIAALNFARAFAYTRSRCVESKVQIHSDLFVWHACTRASVTSAKVKGPP
jgi:hypothetical protein